MLDSAGMQGVAKDGFVLVEHPLHAEHRRHDVMGAPGQAQAQRRVLHQAGNGIAQRGALLRRAEQAVDFVLDDFAQAAHARGDYRQVMGAGFQRHQAEGFRRQAGHHRDVDLAEELGRLAIADKVHALRVGKALELVHVVRVATAGDQ